ncbi:LPXTG cell wall anchor domain-containing protein [Lactobacillus sp. YT155]|uniref:LPXTG cell wall anchor domain-containing protein n=1 Tax=Lactobacillus sp. YT155 TaxID=3060955 RepID=UPI00265FC217|nr:LPXTG cell wall anchor domain-containing protein [Lactobacillus sp. YT155]MDO1605917.1 LPXTG cell wall anchor domain-containing protein [Lactobacillus sp. YT155]
MFTKKSFVNYAIITLMSATILGPFVSTAATVRADVAESPSTNATEEVLDNTQVENSKNEKTSEVKVDKSALKLALDRAANISDEFTQNLSQLDDVINEAKTVMADESATQPEVDSKTQELNTAIDKVNGQADKSKLEIAMNDAAKANSGIYTESSAKKVTAAWNEGFTIMNDSSATQEQVDAVTQKINDAVGMLITQESYNNLIVAVNTGMELYYKKAPKDYPYTSIWMELNGFIENAYDTLLDIDNQDQASVDSATKNLNAVIAKVNATESTNNQVATTTVKTTKEAPKTLPQTGEANTQDLTLMGIVGLALTAVLGYVGLSRKKN